MGLTSQLLGSIMSARKRSVAILALCSYPLARTSLLTTPSSGLIPKFEINEYTDNFVATVIRILFLKKIRVLGNVYAKGPEKGVCTFSGNIR